MSEEWTPQEKAFLRNLPTEETPSEEIERWIAESLRAQGRLLGAPRKGDVWGAGRRWALLAAAAAFAAIVFSGGFLAGRWQPEVAVPPTRQFVLLSRTRKRVSVLTYPGGAVYTKRGWHSFGCICLSVFTRRANVKRRLGQVALFLMVLLLFAAPALFFESPLNNPLSNSPVVLFVGDFSSGGFGSLVDIGVKRAVRDTKTEYPFALQRITVYEPNLETGIAEPTYINFDQQLDRLRRRLIEKIADVNVVAIISANSSSTAPVVLEIGRTFHVPVLLTVATNDRLMDGFSECAFRLLPRDGRQAEVISHWCTAQLKMAQRRSVATPASSERESYIAIAYDPRRYGQDLQEELRRAVGNTRVLAFPLGTTTETAGILNYASTININAWVLLGYKAQAIEFYAKRMAVAERKPLLMSDGAYGTWLADVADDAVSISFPLPKLRPGEVGLPGYAVFGRDAMVILRAAVETAVRKDIARRNFPQTIREVALDLTQKNELMQPCIFNKKGENMRATFGIFKVKSLPLPKK